MKKVFYEKIGSRYKPVKEYDDTLMSAFPKGTHLVVCRPGVKSYSYQIEPAFAPMLAAGKYVEDDMVQAIVKGFGMKPKQTPLTNRQCELWDELQKSLAEQDFVIYGPCAADAAREGIKTLRKEVEKMLNVPSVKLAYEHFMMVWQLTKEKDET